jgi:hypothetical protein
MSILRSEPGSGAARTVPRPGIALRATLAACAALMPAMVFPAAAAAPRPGTLGPIKAIEQAIETTALSVSLPGAAAGALIVTPCAGCAPLSLAAGPATLWLLGSRPARFADVRAALASAPRTQLLVVYRSRTHELVRLVAYVR